MAKVAVRRTNYPLLSGLLAYWTFDETSGNRADSSGNGHALTPSGNVSYDTGLKGNAALFHDGSLDQLLINPCPSTLNLGGAVENAFTVALWYNVYTVPKITYNYRRLIDHSDSITFDGKWRRRGYSNIISTTGPTIVTQISNGETNDPYASNSSNWYHGEIITTHTWYWVLIEYDPVTSYFNLYQNNVFQAVGSPPTPYECPQGIYQTAVTVPLIIGATTLTNNNTMDGLIDETGIWSRVLTADEKAWLYNSGSGRSYAEITAYTG